MGDLVVLLGCVGICLVGCRVIGCYYILPLFLLCYSVLVASDSAIAIIV